MRIVYESYSDDVYNSEVIHSLLRSVLRGNHKLPDVRSRPIADLAVHCELVSGLFWLKPGEANQRSRNTQKIKTSLETLARLMPKLRVVYESHVKYANEEGAPDEFKHQALEKLARWDALLQNVMAAQSADYFSDNFINITDGIDVPTLAVAISAGFQFYFPSYSKLSCYRFVTKIVQHISGEENTAEGMRKLIQRRIKPNKSFCPEGRDAERQIPIGPGPVYITILLRRHVV